MMVRYRPLPESWRRPSEAEPYSPEIAEFAPLAVWGSVSVPTELAVVPPAPRLNSSRVIGEAVSSASAFESEVELVTVSMTRSPTVKSVMPPADAPPEDAASVAEVSKASSEIEFL